MLRRYMNDENHNEGGLSAQTRNCPRMGMEALTNTTKNKRTGIFPAYIRTWKIPNTNPKGYSSSKVARFNSWKYRISEFVMWPWCYDVAFTKTFFLLPKLYAVSSESSYDNFIDFEESGGPVWELFGILVEGLRRVTENVSMGDGSAQIRIDRLPNTSTNRCCCADMFGREK